MSHFLEISQLSRQQIECLVTRARDFKQGGKLPAFNTHSVANLFYENSTRTRISFELAATRLSMPVINVDLQNSSETKGEVIEDTISTLAAMGIKLFVIRHKQEGLQQLLANKSNNQISVINAGDGTHAHPSQAMLDLMTIMEKKPDIRALKIAIVGNIRHSRVANSLQCVFSAMQAGELSLVAPEVWQPETIHYGRSTDSLKEGLADADVVICLRVQQERLQSDEQMDLASYRQHYALTAHTLRYAKPTALIMHPGPINRGVEIDSDVADGAQSLILEQVTNGVFMRMAILEMLINPRQSVSA